MNLTRFSGGTLGLLAAGALVLGCSSKSDDCNANNDCNPFDGGPAGMAGASGAAGTSGQGGLGASAGGNAGGASSRGGASGRSGNGGDAGTGGPDAGAAGAPAMCDGTLSPEVDSCVISDTFGVFVAPTGSDATGDGTEATPYATVSKALKSIVTIQHIYVCAADYTEPSTLEIPSGTSIYGGFSCANGLWQYDPQNRANLRPSSPIGVALKSVSGVRLQDLSIQADDAASPGGSSFGMTVVESTDVVLTRVEIRAGKGGAGSAGGNGDPGAPGTAAGVAQDGKPGTCTSPPPTLAGGAPVVAKCQSQGGNGGTGYVTASSLAEQNGAPGSPILSSNGGPGGATVGSPGIAGTQGQNGADGALGAAALAMGTFSATGYAIANGSNGSAGKPGQGGGGGGASFVTMACVGSSGGAGGMGGCGGQPGLGGMGGGASVALLSWNSEIVLNSCTLTALAGGAGGGGGLAGLGGGGQAGGVGGNPNPPIAGIKTGGKGGDGGGGGDGGSGAGGSGGPSIALVYQGTEPTRKDTTLGFPLKGGALGQGGHLSMDMSKWASDGSVGVAQEIYVKQ